MNLRIFFLVIFCWPIGEVMAINTIALSSISGSMKLADNHNVYCSFGSYITINQVNESKSWLPFMNLETPVGLTTGWIKLSVTNDLFHVAFLDLNFRSADSIQVFVADRDKLLNYQTGPYTDAGKWLMAEDPGIVPLQLQPGNTYLIYARLWSDKGRPFSLQNSFLQTREHTLNNTVADYRKFIGRIEFNGFFLGAVIFAMLFFLFIYLKAGDRAFLFYALYLLGAALYSIVVKTLPFSLLARTVYLDYPLVYKLGEPIQYFFFAGYSAFGMVLLNIDRRYGWLYKALKVFTAALLIAGGTITLFNFTNFNYQFQQKAFVWSRIVILPVVAIFLVAISLKVRNNVKWFFVVGSFFFFAGGLLAVATDPKSNHLFFGKIDMNPTVFYKSGILLECLCFALALGYRMRQAQLAKDESAKAYIEQLELNRSMIESEKGRLEKIVTERTESILQRNRVIEEQRKIQQQSLFERKLAEMEMRALRSQMSPHFIFNSLNSIRYQILKKDYEGAAKYLTSFSKLLRYILQVSREHVVTLAEEIEINRLYVQIESLRFDQGFEFVINVSGDVDLSEIMFPPMLLQPYIENAVKHGLLASKREQKTLTVNVEEISDGFSIIIEDNGIGRAASQQHTMLEDKQSLGMRIADERIDLFNNNFIPTITVKVIDLYQEELSLGTRVIFNYKTNS